MNSTDGYFDVTANRTKIVTVPDGYEVRLHKIGSSEDIFPNGLSTKDIKDLNNTLVVDLSTPGTIDLRVLYFPMVSLFLLWMELIQKLIKRLLLLIFLELMPPRLL